MSLHLQFIQFLGTTTTFWPESPILAGTPMQYPIGMDWFNALLWAAGLPLLGGLALVGVISSLAAGWQLWRWAGAFGICAFLFAGGLNGFSQAWAQSWGDWQNQVSWKNPFLTMMIPQRNMLFLLPAGILLLRQWQTRLSQSAPIMPTWAEVVLYSSLPIFGLHAFLFFTGLLILNIILDADSRWNWFITLVCALPVGSLLVFLVTGRFAAADGIHWNPGWMQGTNGFGFWLLNFGMMLPLMLGAIFYGWKSQPNRPLLINCSVWFILCSHISFSSWEWDNTKLMIWSWIGLLPIVWQYLLEPLRPSIRILILVVLCFTGLGSVLAKTLSHPHYLLVPKDVMNSTIQAVKGISKEERIACRPTYNSPLALLGRPVIAGYEGHLWSHGLPFRAQHAALESFLKGEEGWQEKAEQLRIRHVFWGAPERQQYGDDKPWMVHAHLLYSDGHVRLYQLPPSKKIPD